MTWSVIYVVTSVLWECFGEKKIVILGKRFCNILIKPEFPQKVVAVLELTETQRTFSCFISTFRTYVHNKLTSTRWNTILFSPFNPYKERIMRGAIGKRCGFHKTYWPFFLFCCSFRCTYVSAIHSTQYWWVPWWSSDCHQEEVLRVLGFCWTGYKRQFFNMKPQYQSNESSNKKDFLLQ